MHVPVAASVTQHVLVRRSQGVVPQSRAAPDASTGTAGPSSAGGGGVTASRPFAPASSVESRLASSKGDASQVPPEPGQVVTTSMLPPQPTTARLAASKATISLLASPMRAPIVAGHGTVAPAI